MKSIRELAEATGFSKSKVQRLISGGMSEETLLASASDPAPQETEKEPTPKKISGSDNEKEFIPNWKRNGFKSKAEAQKAVMEALIMNTKLKGGVVYFDGHEINAGSGKE